MRGTRERRKQRDGTFMDLEDQSAFCDENVARGEPGRRGLRWSIAMYFSRQEPNPGIVANTVAFPLQSILSMFSEQYSVTSKDPAQRPRPWERGLDRGKGNWIGGVKHSCER